MTFKIGDKVRLRPETEGRWPKGGLNTVVRKHMVGIVQNVYDLSLPPHQRSYLVKFPPVRSNTDDLTSRIPAVNLQFG